MSEEDAVSKDEVSEKQSETDPKQTDDEQPLPQDHTQNNEVKEEDDENNDDAPDEEDDDESSDEEPPVGMLDRPIEILYTKRAKRVVDRFDPRTVDKKPPIKTSTVPIPNGKGLVLAEHPKVVKNITKESSTDLKVIFSVLFGHKRVKLADVKKVMKKWNGWEVEANSVQHHKLEENAANLTIKNLEWAMVTLDIEIEMDKKGKKSKEGMMEMLSEWCLKPEPRKKPPPKESKEAPKKTPPKPKVQPVVKNEPPAKKPIEKNTDKPKRPLSAYFIWMTENRSSIVDEIGSKDVKSVTKAAGEKWNGLTSDEKKAFEGRARKLKEKYDKELLKWNTLNPNQPKSPPKKLAKVKLTSKRASPFGGDGDMPKKKIKKRKVTMPTDKDLVKAIKKILEGADLETITMKQVVQKVYDRYPGVDLLSKKSFIKSKVKEIIA